MVCRCGHFDDPALACPQAARYAKANGTAGAERPVPTNAEADGALLEQVAAPDAEGRRLLTEAAERFRLSARGYHRVLRLARALADLGASEAVRRVYLETNSGTRGTDCGCRPKRTSFGRDSITLGATSQLKADKSV